MQRITISIDQSLGETFDKLIASQGYESRSEAVRDLVRAAVEAQRTEKVDGNCIANLSYVYAHGTRALAQRLSEIGHEHHDLVVATTHILLDHENCLETTILKGSTSQVRSFANRLCAERGVRFAQLNLISVKLNDQHGDEPHHKHSGHHHLTPTRG